MQRPPADIQRIVDDRDVVLQQVAEHRPGNAADQYDRRHPRLLEFQGFGQFFDGERRVGIHMAIARRTGLARRRNEIAGTVEFGE